MHFVQSEDVWIPSGPSIKQFCDDIGDFNHLHKAEWAKLHGKRPVVPGTLTFIRSLQRMFPASIRGVDMVFSSMISEGDLVQLSPPQWSDSEILLAAYHEGTNALANGKAYSRLRIEPDPLYNIDGVLRTYQINPEAVQRFSRYVEGERSRDILYLMAFSSHALLTAVNQPISDIERELHEMIVNQRIAPVYQSIDFRLAEDVELSQEIDFYTQTERVKKRNYLFTMECVSGGSPAYTAQAVLKAVPLRVLLKKAKEA